MNPLRRVVVVLVTSLLTLLSLPIDSVLPAEEKATEKVDNPLDLAIDPRAGLQLQAATDYASEEDWKNAVRLLQHLLDGKPDTVARLAGRDGKVERYVSVHTEAERLLAVMPETGRTVYQQTVGRRAAELLEQARKDRDAELFGAIVRRYLYTEAGPAALQGLARQHYRGGRLHFAAYSYAKLIEHLSLARWTNDDLYQATAAFHQRSTSAYADRTLKQLLARSRQNIVRVGERMLTVEQLRQEIERATPPQPTLEWPIYGGSVARSAQGIGGPPFLEPIWRKSMIYYNEEFEQQEDPATLQRLRQAEKQLQKRHRPILPAFSPITVAFTRGEKKKTLLIHRNYWGIVSRDLKNGELVWASPSSWSLQNTISSKGDSAKMRTLNDWLDFYVKQGNYPQIPFDNSMVGTLSSDGKFVYSVEDFAVPPVEANKRYPADIQDAIRHSCLQAYSLNAGKLTWQLGGDDKGPLADCYFLGPPLPLDGLLYLLVEKKQELYLMCIDPSVNRNPKIVSLQPLVRARTPLTADPYRRIRAAHLAYADGILVCPTNVGVVLGVDLLSGGLAWVYPYRPAREGSQPQWAASAPVLADGKVVFTSPDAPSIHCLNLKDGSLVWSREKKADELYLGGVCRGKALIVGTNSVRGISLESGATLWTLETGTPSGRGVARDGVYYLPLKESIRSKRPEILAIDTNKGEVVARIQSRPRTSGGDDFETPGNLLFFGGEVISLTPWEVAVYPQLKTKIAEVNEQLSRNPDNPAGLTERAALRLDRGELPAAIEDLRHALKSKPEAKTRQRARSLLFDSFTDLFKSNFGDADKYLKEYEELGKMDLEGVGEAERSKRRAEQDRRRVSYFLLVGRLRARQGRMVDALQAYLDLATFGPGEEMMSSAGETAVRVRRDVWVRSRVAEMRKKATAEQRKQLEKEMIRRLKDVQGRENVRGLRDFVALFGPDTAGGREAALQLAERLMRSRDYLEAELLLQEVRRRSEDSLRAARAVEMLGRLMTAQSLLPDAVYYYRILRRDFGAVTLPDGKTGAEVWDTLSTDKRLLSYLDESDPLSFGKFQARKEVGDFALNDPIFHFEHTGEETPFFRRHLVGPGFHGHDFHLRDHTNGEDLWTHRLTPTSFQALLLGDTAKTMPRFRYHTRGHLVVLPVDRMVFVLDPVARRILWEKDVSVPAKATDAERNTAKPRASLIAVDPRDGVARITYDGGWVQHLGQDLVLSPSVLCLSTREGLQAFEPRSGRLLWTRSDVPENMRIFGDEEYVFLVEENADGEAVSTRVLRLVDGGTVRAADFADLFSKRVQIFGRTLLLAEKDAKGVVMLRQYDIPTGADVWKVKYRPKSLVLHSEDAHWTGAVEPDGKVHVVDLRTHQEVMTGRMEEPAEHLRNVQTIYLLHDAKHFYFACQTPRDINNDKRRDDAGLQANVMTRLGMRGVPVNGYLYAFERGSGDIHWFIHAKNQFLVLDQFSDLPVVFLTARSHEFRNTPREEKGIKVAAILIEKRSGRIVAEDNDLKTKEPFYAVRFHPQTGTIDFVSPTLKITARPAQVEK